jgi:putative ABC transport system ATP-binding protein
MNEAACAATGPPILETVGLERTYSDGQVHALRGVSLTVADREFVAITGPSGCGKSTLLHLLGGLDRPTVGEIRFRGSSLRTLDLDTYRARRVGFVFQSFHLIATLTALENVQVPMLESDHPRNQRKLRARTLLEEVGVGHRAGHLPRRISVGERQRVAIARALANEPDLLLADEPTGNLDSAAQDQILQLLQRLSRERGLTLVVVTHSQEVASRADREVALLDGRRIR